MSHLSIYLDKETEAIVRKAARKNSLSMSKWISCQIKKTATSDWSDTFKNLAGAIPDLPSLQEIRAHSGPNAKRENW